MQLDDKAIVVVGGTTGLGLAGAAACVAAGARVVVVGRSADSGRAAVRQLGSAARLLSGDAADPQVAPRAIELAVQDFGRCDGLYHVAGGSGRSRGDGPLHELTDDGWSATLDVNLRTAFNSCRAAARQFLTQGSGSVVVMSSVLAYAPSPQYFATHAYAAAKAGVIGLARAAASYYAPHNIRFNVVAPALVDTPMSQRAVGSREILDYVAGKQPLGGVGQPQDLDGAVVYLLSDQSQFVTGQVLAVDRGWSVTG